MTDLLTNPRSERVRSVARLSGRSARRRAGLFLAEGPSCVREALRAGAALEVYATAEALRRHPELAGLRENPPDLTSSGTSSSGRGRQRPRLWECSEEVLAAMADTVTPQGVIAVCPLPSVTFADVLAARPRLVAVLAHVRDPGNAGTVIRAADATGADAVVLTDASVDPFNPKCVRSTTGSLFSLPVVAGVPLGEAIAGLRSVGCTVLAADGAGTFDLDHLQDVAATGLSGGWRGGPGHPEGLGAPSAGLRAPSVGLGAPSESLGARGEAPGGTPDLASPTAWVFGNEAWGMSEADRALADAVVRVPIHGRAESLNLAMAATVCLYASARALNPPNAPGHAPA